MDRTVSSLAATLADAWLRRPQSRAAMAAVGDLLSVLAPSDCVCCVVPDTVLCRRCRAALRASTVRPYWAQEDAESLPLRESSEPGGAWDPLPAIAAGVYKAELSSALLAFKNRQRIGLATVLGPALAGALRAALEDPTVVAPSSSSKVVLVPVPSRLSARARRGYAPVDVLVNWVATRGLLPAHVEIERWLTVSGSYGLGRREQKGKGRRARGQSKGSMRLHRQMDLTGSQCIIVDDVLTTGATAAEAYRCLSEAGAHVNAVVVVAATRPPRHAESDTDHAKVSAHGERETLANSMQTGRA